MHSILSEDHWLIVDRMIGPFSQKKPTSELPGSLLPLTNIELVNRYIAESKSRVSFEEAELYVNDRERERKNIGRNNILEQSQDFIAQFFPSSSENPMVIFDKTSRASQR